MQRWDREIEVERDKYLEKLKEIISNADIVRNELLKRARPIPEVDRKEAAVFADGLKNPDGFPNREAALYLEELAQRVPPPQ